MNWLKVKKYLSGDNRNVLNRLRQMGIPSYMQGDEVVVDAKYEHKLKEVKRKVDEREKEKKEKSAAAKKPASSKKK